MLYAPLVTGLVVYPVPALSAALLLALTTGLFFAQNAWGLVLRGRAGERGLTWLIVYGATAGATGFVLLLVQGLWRLLPLAVPAAALLGLQAWQRRATRRQIDHSTINEMLSATVMASGATAAYLAAGYAWGPGALAPWLAFALYFGGTVLYVKMRVSALRQGHVMPGSGAICLSWHVALLITALFLFGLTGGVAAGPALLRAALGWWRPRQISLRRLGVTEMVHAAWFCVWVGVSLSRL